MRPRSRPNRSVRRSAAPLPILETRTEAWPDEAACERRAQVLAAHAAIEDVVITLDGPLGAGKTTFTRHLLRALGVKGRVKSPSYAVVEPYEVERAPGLLAIWHFDFYRFDDPREWEDAGFREIFATPGLKMCEWSRKAEGLMPEPDLSIGIDIDAGEQRMVRFEARSARGLELLQA